MSNSTYEIFLGSGEVGAAKWRLLLRAVSEYLKFGDRWKIFLTLDGVTLRYYLVSPRPLPASLGLADFLLKKSPALPDVAELQPGTLRLYHQGDDCLDILRRLASRDRSFCYIMIVLRSYRQKSTSSTYLVYKQNQKNYIERLTTAHSAEILAADFSKNKSHAFKKFPKYLKSEKVLKLLQGYPENAFFEVDSFPYCEQKQFLSQSAYDFEKHSIVLGGSGSGKSKFLASFIDQIYQHATDQYKIVVIDPHDSLKHDCRQIPSRRVVDFCDVQNSVDLFRNDTEDANVSVELTLTLFRSLMGSDYNTQLERVLRFASYLLMTTGQFSFLRLRRLLTDIEFCNKVVKRHSDHLPDTVTRFSWPTLASCAQNLIPSPSRQSSLLSTKCRWYRSSARMLIYLASPIISKTTFSASIHLVVQSSAIKLSRPSPVCFYSNFFFSRSANLSASTLS